MMGIIHRPSHENYKLLISSIAATELQLPLLLPEAEQDATATVKQPLRYHVIKDGFCSCIYPPLIKHGWLGTLYMGI